MTLVDTFLLAAVLALLPAYIANRKGYSFLGTWVGGALLLVLVLPWAIFCRPNPETRRDCPHCRTPIDRRASVCPQCGRDVPPPEPLPARPAGTEAP